MQLICNLPDGQIARLQQVFRFLHNQHIKLNQGELLFMNQSATHEILEAQQRDLAVNFIVLPEFFNNVLTIMGEEEPPTAPLFGGLPLRTEQWCGLSAF